jgi:hypothetical protein
VGAELRTAPAPPEQGAELVWSAVVAELRARYGVSAEEIEANVPTPKRLMEDLIKGYHTAVLHYREVLRKVGRDDVTFTLLRERLRMISAMTPGVLVSLGQPPRVIGPFPETTDSRS